MKYLYGALLLLSFSAAQAADSLCDVINLPNCSSINKMARRSSAQSLPSVGTASQFNPANVSHDRGIGMESFYQSGNTPSFNIVTGTGRTGAALVSSRIENGFFGNRVLELDEDYIERHEKDNQYKSPKYSFALGRALYKGKNLGIDVGMLFKYNTKIKQVNLGTGLSMRLGFLSLGASVYKDDVHIKFRDVEVPQTNQTYEDLTGKQSYQEKFTVTNYFAGLKFANIFLDYGVISTKYKLFDNEPVKIQLYSASFIYKKWLLNSAMRKELSPMQKFKDGELSYDETQTAYYGGLQYSLNKFMIVGMHYNYYLLEEISASLAVFF